DRADVNSTCRLCGEQHGVVATHFASDDDLLLITAGERSGRELRVGRADVELLDSPPRLGKDTLPVESARPAGELMLQAQSQVVRDTEVEDQAAAVAILGDVREAGIRAVTN